MGIGSFFSSLFSKEESQKEIRELNVEPAHREREKKTQGKQEGAGRTSREADVRKRSESAVERSMQTVSGTDSGTAAGEETYSRSGAEGKSRVAKEGAQTGAERKSRAVEESARTGGEGRSRAEGKGRAAEEEKVPAGAEEKARSGAEERGRNRSRRRARSGAAPEAKGDGTPKEEAVMTLAEEKIPAADREDIRPDPFSAKESASDEAEEKSRVEKDEERRVRREYFQAKKDLYHYIDQAMRNLYAADQQDEWDQLEPLTGPSDAAIAALDRVQEELPDHLWALIGPFLDETLRSDPAGLQPAFLSMLLPFYSSYRQEFGEFSYNTFLNRQALELYRRLTGRKYRLGYRNRYENGTAAFEWKGERYKVYNSRGILLCDAVFEDGAIKEGYASVPGDEEDPEWTILRKGIYRDGQFTDGAVEYVYKRSIDL